MADSRLAHILRLDRSLAACLLGTFVLRCAAAAMGVMIQFYFEYIDKNVYSISNTEGGLIIAAFFAAELIGAPLFGAWSDRYGRKVFIVLGPLFGAIAVQITAMTTVIWILIITRLLEGLSTASNAPASLGYISAATSKSASLRGRVVGFFEIATVGGMAGGLWLGGKLWDHFGAPAAIGFLHLTSPAFAVDGLIYLISLLILALGLRDVHMDPARRAAVSGEHILRDTLRRYRTILGSRRVLEFVPAWLAVNAVLGLWLNHIARQLTRQRDFPDQLLTGGFSAGEAGTLFAVFAVLFAGGILAWGCVLGRLRKTWVMMVGSSALIAAGAILLVINHMPGLQSAAIVPLVVLFAAALFVMSGFTPAALAHLADITEDHAGDRGAIMGMYSVFLGVGQFVGSSLGGPFADWRGMDGVIVIWIVLAVFSLITVLHLRSHEDQDRT